jgi:hypothetical protein
VNDVLQSKAYAAVHQFHSGTAVGDAVTQQMVQLQGHLRALGYRSEIFAEHIDRGLGHPVHPIGAYAGSADELFLVHHSMGNDAFDRVVALPNDIVTVFHNITPAAYFPDPLVQHYVHLGRGQLSLLAGRSVAGIAASNFNRREMRRAGFRRVEVLPVRTDYGDFTLAQGITDARSSNWLFVGRIVANKCQH